MGSAGLMRVVDALDAAIGQRVDAGSAVASLARSIFDAARRDACASEAAPDGLSDPDVDAFVARHLDTALAAIGSDDDALTGVGAAFADMSPSLTWARRPPGPGDPPGFQDAHVNTTLIGVGGLAESTEVRIGASLVAPGTTYPDHRHPPEELYLVLSEGDFRNSDTGWWTPGMGGLVHNPPGIEHTMRARAAPLFAIWCLYVPSSVHA